MVHRMKSDTLTSVTNNRLVIYFHYDPHGQADTACRFAVQAMREQARVLLFVHNGTLSSSARCWLTENKISFLERENEGLDVGAYRAALLHIGRSALDTFDEVILMNYTLAGPVTPLQEMFSRMDTRSDLDFWGLSRHYAMRSRRFGIHGQVPEHIQSHFIAVRRRMYDDFWTYWQDMQLPKSYEDSVRRHETRFTAHFSDLGYKWDTFLDKTAYRGIFVNPIMACPKDLIVTHRCPFFKRRSFFTPYADELRRTDGQAASTLYRYLKQETSFPVDELIASLLPAHPLTAMAQNLHWHYPLQEGAKSDPPVILTPEELQNGVKLSADSIYCLPTSLFQQPTLRLYEQELCWSGSLLCAAVNLFGEHPMLGVLGPAMPLYPEYARARYRLWKNDLSALRRSMADLDLQLPMEENQPLPVPNGGILLVRGSAFPKGLPPLRSHKDFWLLPLLAQKNGFYSADAEMSSQMAARADVYHALLWQVQTSGGAGKIFVRRIKHAILDPKEADE